MIPQFYIAFTSLLNDNIVRSKSTRRCL